MEGDKADEARRKVSRSAGKALRTVKTDSGQVKVLIDETDTPLESTTVPPDQG